MSVTTDPGIPAMFAPSKDERYPRAIGELLSSAGAREIADSEYSKTGVHLDAVIDAGSLHAACAALRQQRFALECVLGLHRPPNIDVVYLFRPFESGQRVRLRATLPENAAEMPSLASVFAGADWYEREIHDMFGVHFTGHPHWAPLLLPYGFKHHPLRKDFHGAPVVVGEADHELEEFSADISFAKGVAGPEQRDFFLNMGPQHPSTHGVLRILLHAEAEQVLGGRCHLGYSHRGTEKAAEKKQYIQFLPYTDRIDYLAPLNYNWGYAALLERATGIESTPRAQAIRIIIGEFGRIASHLVWLGTYLLDLGAITPFLYCFEDREEVLTLFEKITGQRMTTSYIVVGGVRNDVPATFGSEAVALAKRLRAKLPDYWKLILDNEIFIQRTRGVGVITEVQARDFGVTGPSLRASGIAFDLRRHEPYAAEYAELDWTIPIAEGGDCQARSIVRMHEMEQSFSLIEQAADKLGDGPSRSKIPRNLKVPAGEYYSATEGPRGVVGWYLVSDGGMTPYRLKIRIPSFANLHVVETLLPGHRVADVVSILGSLDVVIPEIDR